MIFLILLLALVLRLVNLNQSLWLDEAVQAITAQRSLYYIFEEIRGDFHPPLFHFLMHFWVRIFGSTEIALRMPSVLFGVGTVFVVYLIAREISLANSSTSEESLRATVRGVSLAHLAALFLATAPFHIYYSQEARMYSMVTFFTGISMYYFLRVISDWWLVVSGTNEKTPITFYLVSTTLALYSDYYVILVVLAQIIAGMIILRKKFYPPSQKTVSVSLWMSSLRSRSGCFGGVGNAKNFPLRQDFAPDEGKYQTVHPEARGEDTPSVSSRELHKLLSCYLVILLLSIPLFPLLISQLKSGIVAMSALPEWGKLVNLNFLKALPLTFVKFSIGRITIFDKRLYALIVLGILGLFGGVGGWGFRKFIKSIKSEKENYLIILTWFVFPILAAWLISLFIPNYQPFRLLLVLPAFYLLLAYGVFVIRTKSIKILAVIFILTINIFSLFTYYQNSFFWREDWRGVAKFVLEEQVPLVISAQSFNWPLVYYQAENQVITVSRGAEKVIESHQGNFDLAIANKDRIVYTPYLADLYDPQKLTPKWLEETGFVKIKEVSFNQIPVWIYEKGEQHAYRN